MPDARTRLARLLPPLLCAALGGCLVGPNYRKPDTPIPAAFKEAQGWTPAQPSDAADRRDWWTVFNDPVLNDLETRAAAANQTIKVAEANYRQAVALVAEQRAALFPTVGLTGSATRTGSSGSTISTSGAGSHAGGAYSTYQVGGEASWAPDLWGGVRRTIENARDTAQAEKAAIASARLLVQTQLATDYIALRQLDEEKRIYDRTVAAYARSLQITRNKYNVGTAAPSDLLTAEAQLASTQATDLDLTQQRAKEEHAIAVLTGQAPAALTLEAGAWNLVLPQIPAALPSTLLQRRPDVATAERQAAAANALIGVQVAAFYPSLSLTGQGGFQSSELGSLFNASSTFWSLGASAAETVFDAGARSARVRAARATYDAAVANYRQTVLTALSSVEDNLAAQKVLGGEREKLLAAADFAARAEQVALNEYNAGTVDYTTVVAAQATALQDRNAVVSIEASRLVTAVDLINALGGGWTTAAL